jgi:hypothetical protein
LFEVKSFLEVAWVFELGLEGEEADVAGYEHLASVVRHETKERDILYAKTIFKTGPSPLTSGTLGRTARTLPISGF